MTIHKHCPDLSDGGPYHPWRHTYFDKEGKPQVKDFAGVSIKMVAAIQFQAALIINGGFRNDPEGAAELAMEHTDALFAAYYAAALAPHPEDVGGRG